MRVGRAEAQFEGLSQAIDAIERKAETARACAVAFERRGEIPHQRVGDFDDRILGEDRLHERATREIDGRGREQRQRLGCAAECLIETFQQGLFEAGREGCAVLAGKRADAFEAEPAQRERGFCIEPQSFYGQMSERFGFRSGWDDGRRCAREAGHGPRGARRFGAGEACFEAEGCEAAREIGQQVFFAAQKMRRAGDVEKQTIGAVRGIERGHGGRVARAPVGEPGEGVRIGFGIVRADLQEADARACVGQACARRQALRLGGAIDGQDACRVGLHRRARTAASGQPARFWAGLWDSLWDRRASSLRKRRIGQRGSQTETMRGMVELQDPFAGAAVAAALERDAPSPAGGEAEAVAGGFGRGDAPSCGCGGGVLRSRRSQQQERAARLAGRDLQALACFEIQLDAEGARDGRGHA